MAAYEGTTLRLAETRDGVTAMSNAISLSSGFADPTALGSKLHTWLDFTDQAALYTDEGRTLNVSADGQNVRGVADKSGNGYHYQAPVGGIWDATSGQVSLPGGAGSYYVSSSAAAGTASTMEVHVAIQFDNTSSLQIAETQTGLYGDTPNVASAVTLASGATVTVDTSGLAAGTYDLIDVDTLTDNGATLPSGVSVVGNRLQLTVS